MNEFALIARYFAPLTQGQDAAAGLQDDGAVFAVPEGCELVVTSDTLNAGTHFLADAAADDIARKALRVNISDLAAMAAEPYAYQLNIAFPEKPAEDWLAAFTAALKADQEEYGLFCSGGDTTGIQGPLSISITAFGLVPAGQAAFRGGAQAGDAIVLSGPVGDAWIGLQVARGKIDTADNDYFLQEYRCPVPRHDLVDVVRNYAHAAIDISDGLAADLAHICAASGTAAEVEVGEGLFSAEAVAVLHAEKASFVDLLTGGDDYELLLAVPEAHLAHFPDGLVIGRFRDGEPGVAFNNSLGGMLEIADQGWTHF